MRRDRWFPISWPSWIASRLVSLTPRLGWVSSCEVDYHICNCGTFGPLRTNKVKVACPTRRLRSQFTWWVGHKLGKNCCRLCCKNMCFCMDQYFYFTSKCYLTTQRGLYLLLRTYLTFLELRRTVLPICHLNFHQFRPRKCEVSTVCF